MKGLIVKLYEVKTTEYNGKHERSFSHLLAAWDLEHAKKIARKFFEHWYQDREPMQLGEYDPDTFEFTGGSIILKIKSVSQTTIEKWWDEQTELHGVTKLPKAKVSYRKCQRLFEACQYILECLDVGGEQSRQFDEEIRYLKRVLKEARK